MKKRIWRLLSFTSFTSSSTRKAQQKRKKKKRREKSETTKRNKFLFFFMCRKFRVLLYGLLFSPILFTCVWRLLIRIPSLYNVLRPQRVRDTFLFTQDLILGELTGYCTSKHIIIIVLLFRPKHFTHEKKKTTHTYRRRLNSRLNSRLRRPHSMIKYT